MDNIELTILIFTHLGFLLLGLIIERFLLKGGISFKYNEWIDKK